MTRVIAIHSHKGGSGKTLFGINLATILCSKGYNVVVLDLDLSAPSMQTYVNKSAPKKINDIIFQQANLDEVIIENTDGVMGDNAKGKLYFGLGDISGDAIRKLGSRNNDAMLKDLYVLIDLVRNKLPRDPWNADYIIIDTSPGLSTSSINAIALADYLIVMMKLSNSDLQGTFEFLTTIQKALQPKTALVINQIPDQFQKKEYLDKTQKLLQNKIINKIENKNIQFAGIIKYDEEIIVNELELALDGINNSRRAIPHLTHHDGEYNTSFMDLKIDGLNQ